MNQVYTSNLGLMLSYCMYLKQQCFQPRLERHRYDHLSRLIQECLSSVEQYFLQLPTPPHESSNDYQVIMYIICVLAQLAHHTTNMSFGKQKAHSIQTNIIRSFQDTVDPAHLHLANPPNLHSMVHPQLHSMVHDPMSHQALETLSSIDAVDAIDTIYTIATADTADAIDTMNIIHSGNGCVSLTPIHTPTPLDHSSNSISNSHLNSRPKKRPNHAPETIAVLTLWFNANILNPYPSDSDKRLLCLESGITVDQLNNWFINHRRRSGLIFQKMN